jgi:hypothetical protein
MMEEYELTKAIDEAIFQADGWDSDELSTNREKALQYYYADDAIAPSAPGRSSVHSMDVHDMHSAVMAAMMPAFEIDDLVTFEGDSEEDLEQAQSETNAVNYMVMQANDGYMVFKAAVWDALLLRNGLVKIYLDQQETATTETFEDLTSLEAQQVRQGKQGTGEQVDVEVLDEQRTDQGLIDMTVRFTERSEALKIEAVDPTRFVWDGNHDSISLRDVQFCAERDFPTRSELIEAGYDKAKINELQPFTLDTKSDSVGRNRDNFNQTYDAAERSQERIEIWECYYRIDFDGDGIAELRNIVYAPGSRAILDNEEADIIPYAAGTARMQPHRFIGVSVYDLMRNVQDSKTRILRQWHDNQNHANNARIGAVQNAVDMDDLTNSRPGGVVRITDPNALVPIPVPDIGGSCQAALEYMDTVRSERGGASLDLQNMQTGVHGQTASGIERQFSSRELQTADMLRTLSETLVKETYLLCHAAMRLWLGGTVNVRQGQVSEVVDPTNWKPRERVNVKTGLSQAERIAKKTILEEIFQAQRELIGEGLNGILTDTSKMYNVLVDHAIFCGIDNPHRYWTNPESPEAQQAAQAAQQQAQEEQAKQEKLLQDGITVPAELEGMKLVEDARQHDEELRFKYDELAVETEIKEAELVAEAALELEKQAVTNEQSERTDAA